MKRLIAVAAVAALAACAGKPPESHVSEIKTEALGLGPATAPQIPEKWWAAFGDPALDGLVDQALMDSPTLATAMARLRRAESEISLTRAATLPQANFEAQEMRERLSGNYIIPPPYGGSTQWIGTAQANLSWSLDFFGKQESQLAKVRATSEAASLDVAAARLALAGSVTQAYISLARAYALSDAAADAVKQRQSILTLTKTLISHGLEASASQPLAEAQVAAAQVELAHVGGLKDIAVHELALLTGQGANAYDIARPKLNALALTLPDILPADLLARRADIAAAKARILSANAGEEIARKAFYPDINLVGTVGLAAVGLGPLFSSDSLQVGAGPAIHLPIFDGGQLQARYNGAAAQRDESVATYNELLLVAVRQTADALSALKTLNDQAALMQQMRTAADASADVAARRYKSGLAPQLPVFTSQDLVIQARRQDAVLGTDIASAKVSLVMALGGGFVPLPQETSVARQEETHE